MPQIQAAPSPMTVNVTPPIVPQTDPTKCWFDSTPYTTPAALATALQAWVAPNGCTGFEQMVIPANPLGTGVWTDTIDVTVEGPVFMCHPRTCADFGYTCGTNGDGCGGVIDCDSCEGVSARSHCSLGSHTAL